MLPPLKTLPPMPSGGPQAPPVPRKMGKTSLANLKIDMNHPVLQSPISNIDGLDQQININALWRALLVLRKFVKVHNWIPPMEIFLEAADDLASNGKLLSSTFELAISKVYSVGVSSVWARVPFATLSNFYTAADEVMNSAKVAEAMNELSKYTFPAAEKLESEARVRRKSTSHPSRSISTDFNRPGARAEKKKKEPDSWITLDNETLINSLAKGIAPPPNAYVSATFQRMTGVVELSADVNDEEAAAAEHLKAIKKMSFLERQEMIRERQQKAQELARRKKILRNIANTQHSEGTTVPYGMPFSWFIPQSDWIRTESSIIPEMAAIFRDIWRGLAEVSPFGSQFFRVARLRAVWTMLNHLATDSKPMKAVLAGMKVIAQSNMDEKLCVNDILDVLTLWISSPSERQLLEKSLTVAVTVEMMGSGGLSVGSKNGEASMVTANQILAAQVKDWTFLVPFNDIRPVIQFSNALSHWFQPHAASHPKLPITVVEMVFTPVLKEWMSKRVLKQAKLLAAEQFRNRKILRIIFAAMRWYASVRRKRNRLRASLKRLYFCAKVALRTRYLNDWRRTAHRQTAGLRIMQFARQHVLPRAKLKRKSRYLLRRSIRRLFLFYRLFQRLPAYLAYVRERVVRVQCAWRQVRARRLLGRLREERMRQTLADIAARAHAASFSVRNAAATRIQRFARAVAAYSRATVAAQDIHTQILRLRAVAAGRREIAKEFRELLPDREELDAEEYPVIRLSSRKDQLMLQNGLGPAPASRGGSRAGSRLGSGKGRMNGVLTVYDARIPYLQPCVQLKLYRGPGLAPETLEKELPRSRSDEVADEQLQLDVAASHRDHHLPPQSPPQSRAASRARRASLGNPHLISHSNARDPAFSAATEAAIEPPLFEVGAVGVIAESYEGEDDVEDAEALTRALMDAIGPSDGLSDTAVGSGTLVGLEGAADTERAVSTSHRMRNTVDFSRAEPASSTTEQPSADGTVTPADLVLIARQVDRLGSPAGASAGGRRQSLIVSRGRSRQSERRASLPLAAPLFPLEEEGVASRDTLSSAGSVDGGYRPAWKSLAKVAANAQADSSLLTEALRAQALLSDATGNCNNSGNDSNPNGESLDLTDPKNAVVPKQNRRRSIMDLTAGHNFPANVPHPEDPVSHVESRALMLQAATNAHVADDASALALASGGGASAAVAVVLSAVEPSTDPEAHSRVKESRGHRGWTANEANDDLAKNMYQPEAFSSLPPAFQRNLHLEDLKPYAARTLQEFLSNLVAQRKVLTKLAARIERRYDFETNEYYYVDLRSFTQLPKRPTLLYNVELGLLDVWEAVEDDRLDGDLYFFHPRTHSISWTQPEGTVLCQNCSKTFAQTFCHSCPGALCLECFALGHTTKNPPRTGTSFMGPDVIHRFYGADPRRFNDHPSTPIRGGLTTTKKVLAPLLE